MIWMERSSPPSGSTSTRRASGGKAADELIHQVRHRGAGKFDLRSAADRLRQRRQSQGFDADPHGAYRSPIRSQVSTTLEVTHGCMVASKLLKCAEARWASKAARSV